MRHNDIVQKAVSARTLADTDDLENALRRLLPGVTERYLGDNEVNWSSVSSAAQSTSLWIERITNMFDAVMLHAIFQRGRGIWATPAEAVKGLYGFTGSEHDDNELRMTMAEKVTVSLLDSDNPQSTPTLAFRDHGIGLSGREMPTTILSLHGSNKLDHPHLHGVFGKGGSSTCQYSDATILISRKQPDMLQDGDDDMVSLAVVRLEDREDRRLEYFRYLVDGSRNVYSVPAEATSFDPGTLVLHINYHAEKMGVQNWTFEESIYAYGETLLFRPSLPYGLRDDRTGQANVRPEDRRTTSTLAGLGRRLERQTDKIIDKTQWSELDVPGTGSVRLRWWMFDSQDSRRRRAAKGHIVLFTTNGQVHHSWDKSRLLQLAPDKIRVAQRILVEVDCDFLPLKTRARLFDTFRTQMRSGPEARALESAVVDALRGDQDLIDHESRLVSEALESGGKDMSEALLKALNRAISIKMPGLGEQMVVGRPKAPPAPRPADELYTEPTFLSGPDTISALRGRHSSIYLSTNAVDGFVPSRGELLIVPEDGAPLLSFTKSDLRRGRLRVGVYVPADATCGTFSVGFELKWGDRSSDAALRWVTKVEIVDEMVPRGKKERKKTLLDTGSVALLWSDNSAQEGWNDAIAGELLQLPGEALAKKYPKVYGPLKSLQSVPTVVLNEDFQEWASYRKRLAGRRSDETLSSRKDRYSVAVGSAVAIIGSSEKDMADTEDGPQGMSPAQQRRAIAQSARTALVLFRDFDTVMGAGPQ